MLKRSSLTVFVALIGVLATPCIVRADIVSIIDPPGGGEIDEEVGNISEAAFEALGPVVEDHENGTGPQGADTPFTLGGVMISGEYGLGALGDGGSGTGGNPWHCGNLSGARVSFTATDACGVTPAGYWFYADTDPSDARNNYVKFDFAPDAAEFVRAVGLAWLGRDNRAGDSTLTATVTFADSTTMASTPLVIDGDGDGLPNGKDVFIGFEDTGNHGGIIRLEVVSAQTFQSFITFHGWDDIGVVVESLAPTGACCRPSSTCDLLTELDCVSIGNTYLGDDVPCDPGACGPPVEIPTVSEWGQIVMGLLLLVAVTLVTRRFAQPALAA